MSFVCGVIFITKSVALSCSEDSNDKVCYLSVKDNKIENEYFHLEKVKKTVKCIFCDLYVLPQLVYNGNSSYVEIMDFSHSHIKKIKNICTYFTYFGNVRNFNVSHNDIDEFRFESSLILASSRALKTLDLSYNNIKIVTRDYGFNSLKSSLNYLNLSYNKIFSLALDCFRSIAQLQTLKLNNNLIPSLNASFFVYLENLVHLDLSFNAIDSIDNNGFLKLKYLQLLKLNNNKLSTIPTTFDKLVSLKELDLSENSITTLDFDIFSNSPNLEIVNLSNDNLYTFETRKSFKNNPNLSYLDLSNNHLTNLHVSYANNLQTLNATGNRITSVHLFGTSALGILDLSHNNLTAFISIGGLRALRQFYLAHNALSSMQKISLKLPKELHTFDISFNQLDDINASLLSRFKDLQHLSLRQSGIKNVDSSTFAAQSNLRFLDISNNNLTFFDFNSSLPQNNNLAELFLNGNALSALDLEHVSKYFPSLKRIGISDNAWPCTYLPELLEQLYAEGIDIDMQRPEERTDQIAGIGCVTDLESQPKGTQTEFVANLESNAAPNAETVTTIPYQCNVDVKLDYEMIVQRINRQIDEIKHSMKTIGENVVTLTNFLSVISKE